MVPMYIETVPNRGSRPAVLLREGWRQDGKVKKRTIANLSDWPEHKVQELAAVLKGKSVVGDVEQSFDVVRSVPHGHVAAVLRFLRKIKLDQVISRSPSPERDLCLAMLVARITAPGSKLALARGLSDVTADSSLGELLDVQNADEDRCYAAMDWLLERQGAIENALAKRHLDDGALVLYDVTSTYFEGRRCPLAKLGHSRDGKHDHPQIVIGLLTNADGCPIAVEVFDGNTADPTTVGPQIKKLREQFGLKRVVIVGDRGMITEARIREELRGVDGLDWITCLRAPAIAKLLERGSFQLSLFDKRDMVEIADADFPGERLVICKNPLLAEERARKRQELLEATERELERIRAAVARALRPLRGQDRIGLRVGKVLGRFKMGKHFKLTIERDSFGWERDKAAIAAEAALDGIYVVRTTVPAEQMPTADVVGSYKSLSHVERAFRSLKTVELHIRPIYHRKEERVRAHVLLCMLAYYVEWHMRRALAPILFDDDDRRGAHARRDSIVSPARRSERAEAKDLTKRDDAGEPVHSFKSLLRDLATIAKNRIQPKASDASAFQMITRPSPFQQRALDLLGVNLLP
jgi:transposase